MNWPNVDLREVCSFENGDRGKNYPSKSALVDAGVPFVNAGNLQEGAISTDGLSFITDEHYTRLSNGKFRRGDFLFCLRGTLGKFALVDRDINGAIASSLIILRPQAELHPAFLKSYLRSDLCTVQVNLFKNGAAQPNLAAASLKQFKIPLPPLEEQKRIAGILDQADALRRLRTAAMDKLNTLGQAIFHEMFGDLLRNDADWETRNIGDICETMVDCVNRTAPVVEGPTPYRMIRTTNVRHGVVNLVSTRYVDAGTFERWNRRLIPAPGDVILTREAPVGEVGVLQEDGVFLGQRLFLYRPRLDTITADFLSYQMQSNFFTQQFGQFGSGSTVKHLPLPACQGFSVRVPPLKAQHEFSKRIAVSSSLQERYAVGAQHESFLFASLQHRAFRGEL